MYSYFLIGTISSLQILLQILFYQYRLYQKKDNYVILYFFQLYYLKFSLFYYFLLYFQMPIFSPFCEVRSEKCEVGFLEIFSKNYLKSHTSPITHHTSLFTLPYQTDSKAKSELVPYSLFSLMVYIQNFYSHDYVPYYPPLQTHSFQVLLNL